MVETETVILFSHSYAMYSLSKCLCYCLYCVVMCFCVPHGQSFFSPFVECRKQYVLFNSMRFSGLHHRFINHVFKPYFPKSPITKKLKLCHINARSLLAYNNDFRSNLVKMDEIRLILCENFEYDNIAISETWLSESTQNDCSDLYLPNYTIFRKDCKTPNSRGGGVAFYVSNNIKVIPRFDLSSEKNIVNWDSLSTSLAKLN